MAAIQEILAVVDQFTAPFSKFISMAEKAAGSTSAAQRAAETMGQSQRAAAEMAAASYSGAAAASQEYQSTLSGMSHRLAELSAKMESSRQELQEMASAGQRGSQEYRALDHYIRHLSETISDLNAQYSAASAKAGGAAQSVRNTAQAAEEASQAFASSAKTTEHFTASQRQAVSTTDRLTRSIRSLAGAYLSLRGLKELAGLSDTMASVSARLDLVNEKFGTTLDLQKMINDTAQRSRSPYLDTASAVSKMALNAGLAFTGPQDVANFMEQVNKQFIIAGASAGEQRNAMIQLTQAMAAGTLRGEELNSILDQAPGIARAIESYMGIAEGSIKQYAEKGAITAQVVKNAMFAAADDTNRKFASMPMTWSQIAAEMQNTALEKFNPVLDKINEIANSERFSKVMNSAIDGLSQLADAAADVMDAMITAGGFIIDNWSEIKPVLMLAAGALISYNMVAAITNGINRAIAISEGVKAAAMAMSKGAAFAATAAQYGLNAALLACPVTWIVLGITAVAAVIYLAIAAFNHFAGTSISATAVVAGAFAVMAAFILNSSIIPVQRGFAMLANFVGNIFNNPIAAVKALFYDMALTVLGYIRNVAHGIENLLNSIPGVQVTLTSTLDRWYNDLTNKKNKIEETSGWRDYVKPWDYLDLGDTFQNTYNTVNNMLSGGKTRSAAEDNPAADQLLSYIPYDELAGSLSDISRDVGKISKSVSLSEEDLKSLVDMAERRYVNNINLTAQSPVINVSGQNTGNTPQDRKALADTIRDILIEQTAAGSARSTARAY